MKKKLYLCSAKPTMGVCEWWGSCTLRCEQINVCGYIRTLQKQCLNSIWIHSLIQTRWASRHVEKGVCWSAVLILESRKFNISSQSIRNDECPRGVNFRILALGRWYPYRRLKVLILHNICTCGYLYRRGLRVVVLNITGNARASRVGTTSRELPRFFCVPMKII